MSSAALNIPEHDDDLAPWLEWQLVGLDLIVLVAFLIETDEKRDKRQPRSSDATVALDDVLGDKLNLVLINGLNEAPIDRIRSLIRMPRLLLDLQDRIFSEGGHYWDTVPRTPEHSETANRVTSTFLDRIRDGSVEDRIGPPTSKSTKSANRVTSRTWLLALAASLLLAIGLWTFRTTPSPPWGFNRPGALSQSMSPAAYLRLLADAAHEWYNERSETERELHNRLVSFRTGCDALIDADHRQLAADDKLWLIDKCNKWRKAINDLILELENGETPEKTRSKADGVIDRMESTLRERAAAIG